jgi:protein-S-isoprenylcysteine O-methyltransferase Ste14
VSALDVAEYGVRVLGFALLAVAWVAAAWGAISGSELPAGRSARLARRHRAHTVHALGAVPYFAICILLWRPIPLNLVGSARIALLVAGTVLGMAGAVFYLGGRWALGSMYNVSSSLGCELYAGHRLVTTGLYGRCRHPMYLGLALAGLGGLLVYRTWTLVFMLASLVGAVIKAREEERLLAAEFGEAWVQYTSAVPPWIPRFRSKEVDDEPVRSAA